VSHALKSYGRSSLLKIVILGVGLGRGFGVETTHLDESGRLLSASATRPSLIFGLSEVIGNLSAPKRESADIKPDQNSRILRADKQISRFDFLNLGLIGPELILFLA
jgi:hypothetical protein